MAKVMDAYIRVSRVGAREGDEYKSPAIQREHIKQWAKREGVQLGKVVEDEDVSGARAVADRGLEALIKRAEDGVSAGVVVYRIDRFGRNAAEVIVAIKRLTDAGARLAAAGEGIDSSTGPGKLIIGILVHLAEYHLDQIGANWQAALNKAVVEEGKHIACRAPLGYLRGDVADPVLFNDKLVRDARLAVDPATAGAVREAFKLRASGQSHGEVVDYLTRELGRPVVKSTVTGMLSNRVYLGEARGPGGAVKKGAHEALVDEDTFNRVHAKRGIRQQGAAVAGQALLGGLITCAACGHKLRVMGSTNRDGVREASYVCGKHFAGGDCKATAAARVKIVDEHVAELLADNWEDVARAAKSADDRFLEAKAAVALAEQALDGWVNLDPATQIDLGAKFQQGIIARQRTFDDARRTLYDLDDPGLPDAPIIQLDGKPVLYEQWGTNPERDRQQLQYAIAEVTLAQADPKRRRWQPIEERVTVRWAA